MANEAGLVEVLRAVGYSAKVVDYYLKKLNVGVIEGVEGVDSFGGPCGDSMRIYLKVEDGIITDAKFEAQGSAGTFASGSAVTEMIKGKTLGQAKKITENTVLDDIGELPIQWHMGPQLAVDALRKALERLQYSTQWDNLGKRFEKH
ncbi:MAG: iron-sulfur cluster assembly scaffold protein [Candidatus Methanospirareceae archaeon]